MKTLIVVDYQVDFVNGLLPCGQDAIDIEDKIYNKIVEYKKRGYKIIFTKDLHFKNTYNLTKESKLYPLHCEYNTPGFELYGKIKPFENSHITFYKNQNMAIGIEEYLDFDSNEFEIVGIATNICVYKTALYLNELLNNSDTIVTVDSSCCASFDRNEHIKSLENMKQLGINVI